MTLADQRLFTEDQSSRPRFAELLVALPGRLVSWFMERQRKRRTILQLSELADWQLDDIGLERSEVEELVAKAGIRRDPVQFFDMHR